MKKIMLIAGALLYICCVDARAQVRLIKDQYGNILGYEETDGSLMNINSAPVVVIDADTIVTDPLNAVIGAFNTVTGEFRYDNNDLLFSIDGSGNVYDAGANPMGHIDATGKVYDINNDQIGLAPGIALFKLTYFFFFTRI